MRTLIIVSLLLIAGCARKPKYAPYSRNPAGLWGFGSGSSVKNNIGGVKISMDHCLIGLHVGDDNFEYVTMEFKHLPVKSCKVRACEIAKEYNSTEAEILFTGRDSYREGGGLGLKRHHYASVKRADQKCYKDY